MTSILIVEDDFSSAYILQTILTKAGYQVLPVVADQESALKSTLENNPSLILMDITLPGSSDGIEIARHIRAQRDIPIIYLTGQTSEETIKRVKETTPFGFLVKPYNPKSVLITTEMALHKAAVERESKETKQRLATTLGTLRDLIFSTNAAGQISYLNPAAQQFINIALGKILGQSFDKLLPLHYTETNKRAQTFLEFKSDNKASYKNHDVIIYHDSGKPHYFHIQIHELRDYYKQLQGYVIALSDFTEQFQYEQNNRLLALALTSLQDGIIIAKATRNEEYQIDYANTRIANLLNQNTKALLGKFLSFVFPYITNPEVIQAIKLGKRFTADASLKISNNTTLVTNWNITPFEDKNQNEKHLIIIVRDVTQLKQLEDNLRQKQKIEAIGRLSSGIAHDFNNLLSVINGYSQLALSKTTQDNSLYPYLHNIQEAGNNGARLVKQLMLFSRQQTATELRPVDLPNLAINTVQMLKRWLGENIKISLQIDPELWTIQSQETYFEQILMNLCVNARDAMPQGGKIQITLKNFNGKPQMLPEGKYIQLIVEDNGLGIPQDIQKKIFEPFFTTKPIGQGTGFGLSTIYGIVKQHGGSIDLISQIGEGSKFLIYFPALKIEDSEVKKQPINLQPQVLNKHKTVLLYDLKDPLKTCLFWHLKIKKIPVIFCDAEHGVKQTEPYVLVATNDKDLPQNYTELCLLPHDAHLKYSIQEMIENVMNHLN